MKGRRPIKPLELSTGLSYAARDLAFDIGPLGTVSHSGKNEISLGDRIEKYGLWNDLVAENISFTEVTGKDIVIQFLIDDGNIERSNRNNIMSHE